MCQHRGRGRMGNRRSTSSRGTRPAPRRLSGRPARVGSRDRWYRDRRVGEPHRAVQRQGRVWVRALLKAGSSRQSPSRGERLGVPVLRASGLSGLVRCLSLLSTSRAAHTPVGGAVRGSQPPTTCLSAPGRHGGGLSHPATCIGLRCTPEARTSRTNRFGQRPVRPHTPNRDGTPLRRGRASFITVVHPRFLNLGAYRDRRPRVGPARSLFSSQGPGSPKKGLSMEVVQCVRLHRPEPVSVELRAPPSGRLPKLVRTSSLQLVRTSVKWFLLACQFWP